MLLIALVICIYACVPQVCHTDSQMQMQALDPSPDRQIAAREDKLNIMVAKAAVD